MRAPGSPRGDRVLFSPARPHDGGHYGNAILSSLPMTSVREGILPAKRGKSSSLARHNGPKSKSARTSFTL